MFLPGSLVCTARVVHHLIPSAPVPGSRRAFARHDEITGCSDLAVVSRKPGGSSFFVVQRFRRDCMVGYERGLWLIWGLGVIDEEQYGIFCDSL